MHLCDGRKSSNYLYSRKNYNPHHPTSFLSCNIYRSFLFSSIFLFCHLSQKLNFHVTNKNYPQTLNFKGLNLFLSPVTEVGGNTNPDFPNRQRTAPIYHQNPNADADSVPTCNSYKHTTNDRTYHTQKDKGKTLAPIFLFP